MACNKKVKNLFFLLSFKTTANFFSRSYCCVVAVAVVVLLPWIMMRGVREKVAGDPSVFNLTWQRFRVKSFGHPVVHFKTWTHVADLGRYAYLGRPFDKFWGSFILSEYVSSTLKLWTILCLLWKFF